MNLKNTPYHIQDPLGGGENANVYYAIERTTGKKIALKLSKSNSEGSIQQEGELTQKIAARVPNVRRVVSLGHMATGEFYVAYEFVEQTLTSLLKERRKENKPFTLNEAAELLMPIAQALDQIHLHFKIAHSDIKPDNILIGAEGSVRLADFGNATPFGSIAQHVSPFYMTPEQANNQPCLAASDIYGLALVLYEMLTLSPPIPGDNAVGMSIKVLKQLPIPIQDLRPDIPSHLAQHIMKGLAKAPSARPQQASALLAGFPPPLAKARTPIPKLSEPNMPKPRPGKPKVRRSQKLPLLALLMILLLAILGGGGYLLVLVNQSATTAPVATSEAITEAGAEASPDLIEPESPSTVTVAKQEDVPSQEEDVSAEGSGNSSPTATLRPTTTTTRRPTSTPTPLVTPTSPPAVTNTIPNTNEVTLLVEEATIIVEPTFTKMNSTPSATFVQPTFAQPTFAQPTFAEPTFAPPTFAQLTFVPPTSAPPTSAPTFATPTFVQPTVPPPTKAPTAIPTTVLPTQPPPTKTATQAPANYDLAPESISPKEGEVIGTDIVTFEWNWNGPWLAEGQQFLLRGFRDGQWLELTRTGYTKIDVPMRGYGNFETNWEWYVVVIDQRGNEISPRSRSEFFGISLSSN